MKRFVAAALLVLSSVAWADQCAWVTRGQATEAEGALKGKRVVEWCEPCHDAKPSVRKAKLASSVKVRKTEGEYFEVVVNEKAVDLAYLYVEDKPGHFRNVADLVSCPAEGVAKTLE